MQVTDEEHVGETLQTPSRCRLSRQMLRHCFLFAPIPTFEHVGGRPGGWTDGRMDSAASRANFAMF